MKHKFYDLYMNMALNVSELSYCKRKKVGTVIVKDDNIVFGYNGTLPGKPNICEDEHGKTHDGVIHAEMNALNKLMKGNFSSVGAIMFVTMAPCHLCAPHIIMADISEVVYYDTYRLTTGLEILQDAGIKITDYRKMKC